MKLARTTWIGLALMGVIAIGVGVILFATLSSPSRRTVAIDGPKAVDPVFGRANVDERIAAIRKAGEPILVTEFAPKPIPPEQNAAEPLMAAIKWMDKPEINNDPYWNLDISPKLAPQQWQIVDAAMAKFAPALALTDQADGRTAVDWKIKFETPAIRILLRSLNGARQLQNLLHGAAESAHHAGRDDEAVHRITQMAMLARHTDRHMVMVGHLVATGLARLTTQAVADIVPALKIGSADGAASPGKVSALIAVLLDDATLQNGLLTSALSERMMVLDTFQCLLDGKLTAAELARSVSTQRAETIGAASRGELLAELPLLLDYSTALVTAAKSDRLPDFRRAAPAPPGTRLAESRAVTVVYDRVADSHFAALANLRLAALALAARWWANDHDGSLPGSLEELVPKYLPAIPADPLVPAPGVLLYRPSPDPAVYSAGTPAIRATSRKGSSPEVVIRLTAASR